MNWMLLPLKRYAEFHGRSRPREYWLFTLFLVLGLVVCNVLDVTLGLGTRSYYSDWGPYGGMASYYYQSSGIITLIFLVATFIPSLAVSVRRLHDSDRSGWWLLIGLLPVFGWLILLIFMAWSGTRGPNRFGPDPVEG